MSVTPAHTMSTDTIPSDNASHTTPLSDDTFDLNSLVVLASDDELSSLTATDIPISDIAGLADTEAPNERWAGVWETLSKADAKEVLFVDCHPSDEDHAADQRKFDEEAPPAPTSIAVIPPPAERGWIGGLGLAVGALALAAGIVMWIVDQNWSNHQRRSEFTQTIVRRLRQNNPSFNYVICSTRHEIRPQGQARADFAQETVSLPVWWGFGSVSYTVYSFRAGIFRLVGDGGYLNWAYFGNVASDTGGRQPRTVTFVDPRRY